MRRDRGYALLIVLSLLLLLFILTTAFSYNVKTETTQGLSIEAEEAALNAADSGIQYALESVRQKQTLPTSYSPSSWLLLQIQSGTSICFQVFVQSTDPISQQETVESHGETVRGNCGDYAGKLPYVLAVRVVRGDISTSQGTLLSWSEVLP